MLLTGFTRRSLGTATRGPPLRAVTAHIPLATAFFSTPALSYSAFHQRCTSLRLFVYWGVIGGLTLQLLVDPPRSTYWRNWGFWHAPGNFIASLTRKSDSLFFHETEGGRLEVAKVCGELVANRRLSE